MTSPSLTDALHQLLHYRIDPLKVAHHLRQAADMYDVCKSAAPELKVAFEAQAAEARGWAERIEEAV